MWISNEGGGGSSYVDKKILNVNPILDMKISSVLLRSLSCSGYPPGFCNGLDWRALAESHPPKLGKLRKSNFFKAFFFVFEKKSTF